MVNAAPKGDRPSSSSQRPPVSDLSLVSVLRDEMKVERDYYRRDEILLSDPPNDFELDDTAGKNSFFLLKDYKREAIVIEVDLGSQPSADDLAEYDSSGDNDDDDLEEDEEDEVIVPVSFKCSISKAGGALIFDCQSDGESIEINHVSYEASDAPRSQEDDEDGEEGEEGEEKGEIDEDTENYSGPDFEELDETLQQAFLDYLEERGVTSELGQYLRSACVDKSSREYVAWLQKVRDWVSK